VLVWHLTGGTDARDRSHNASRTMLYAIDKPGMERRALLAVRRSDGHAPRRPAIERRLRHDARGNSGTEIPNSWTSPVIQQAALSPGCWTPGPGRHTYGDEKSLNRAFTGAEAVYVVIPPDLTNDHYQRIPESGQHRYRQGAGERSREACCHAKQHWSGQA